jgi:DNA-directed RNA polymerase specialized sigma24 family protein
MNNHRVTGAVPGATPVAIERAHRFLKSAGGRAAVHRILEIQRLPRTLADDLGQEALRRVADASERGKVIENPEGFVTSALHYAALDIVRGRVRSTQALVLRAGVDPDAEERGWSHDAIDNIASPLDVEVDALAFESLAAVRRAIHQRLGPDPAAGAAALAYLAVTVDGAATPPDCPQPIGGASPQEAADWAGLWYAGRHHCFPMHGAMAATPPAVRKRRSRASERFHSLLVRAAVTAGVGPDNRLAHGRARATLDTTSTERSPATAPPRARASTAAKGSRNARSPESHSRPEPKAAVGG